MTAFEVVVPSRALARRIAAVLVIACLSGALVYALLRVLAAEGAVR